MAGTLLAFSDLSPLAPSMTSEQAAIYIEDVEAQAAAEAPCILEPGFEHEAAARSILRHAVLRWHNAGEGGLASRQQSAGPFGLTETVDTRSHGEGRLYAGEIRRLKALCRASATGGRRRAFTVAPR